MPAAAFSSSKLTVCVLTPVLCRYFAISVPLRATDFSEEKACMTKVSSEDASALSSTSTTDEAFAAVMESGDTGREARSIQS